MSAGTAAPPPTTRYLPRRPDPDAPVRLFCFHHAGGGASEYAGWQRSMGPGVCAVPVQLPGREGRIREPRFQDIDALLDDLDAQLAPELDAPYAFYGHSMGALIAYRLARRRFLTGRSLPRVLLVGAHPAPHRPHALRAVSELAQEDLVRLLSDIGGFSPLLLQRPEWMAWAVDLIRDDLRVCGSHDPAQTARLPIPIEVFTGTSDPLLRGPDAHDWAAHTDAGCVVHAIPGGHFFTRDSPREFLERLSAALPAGTAPASEPMAS